MNDILLMPGISVNNNLAHWDTLLVGFFYAARNVANEAFAHYTVRYRSLSLRSHNVFATLTRTTLMLASLGYYHIFGGNLFN